MKIIFRNFVMVLIKISGKQTNQNKKGKSGSKSKAISVIYTLSAGKGYSEIEIAFMF
jgi:hypothetical protein